MVKIKNLLDHEHYPSIMYLLMIIVTLLLFFSLVSIIESAQKRSFAMPVTGQAVTGQAIAVKDIQPIIDYPKLITLIATFLIQLTMVSVIIFICYAALRPIKRIFFNDEFNHFSNSAKRRLRKKKDRTVFLLRHH